MYYYLYKKRYPEDVLVYIEEYNKAQKTVVFDFIDSNEHSAFTRYSNLEYGDNKPSMVVLKNYTKKSIRENTIYAISPKTINEWRTNALLGESDIDSFIIGYIIESDDSKEEIFKSSISFNEFYDFGAHFHMFGQKTVDRFSISLKGKLSVTVRDVGQGNWNEIAVENNVAIVYDAGASIYATKAEIRDLIDDRNEHYANSKPVLFLSHWDKDHYHSLVGMTDQELRTFSFFVCRSLVPNKTSRILFQRINAAVGGQNIISIPPEARNRRGGPTRLIPITPNNSQLSIYNGQEHKDRNLSGIALSVRTATSSVILPGDLHYEQISRDVLPYLNYPHKHHLVVPHHGGKAGNYVYQLPNNVIKGAAIISVGPNNYGHPLSDYVSALSGATFNVMQTRHENRDITIRL